MRSSTRGDSRWRTRIPTRLGPTGQVVGKPWPAGEDCRGAACGDIIRKTAMPFSIRTDAAQERAEALYVKYRRGHEGIQQGRDV